MAKLILMVGPPGSGKTSYCEKFKDFYRISQDDQGKIHWVNFCFNIHVKNNIIVDRMGFNKQQRDRYLKPAKEAGYETEIVVIHENYETCLNRCLKRENHPTIKDETNAKSALNTFFSKYERVEDSEADKVTRIWPEGIKDKVVICDLDGTLCNTSHREYLVKNLVVDDKQVQKKNWPKFFAELCNDTPNWWCVTLLDGLDKLGVPVIYCSGRPDSYRKETEEWLSRYELTRKYLFMRNRNDSRKDSIAKEIILDFEILTRWKPFFAIDDRTQVVQMWRSRGITTLQCAEGNF